MEALSQSLQPYKDLVGQVASIVTIIQFFSGALICKDIFKRGNTKDTNAVPFIGGVVVGILMLKYAVILDDPAMLQVNVAAIFLNFLYTAFYYLYTDEKWEEVLKPGSVGVAIIAVFLGYAGIENPENIEFRYGLLVTISMLLLMGAPLIDLKEIIKKKDASAIPFPIIFTGAIVSCLWFLYGVILLNHFMIVQNIIGLVLCLVQLFLIFKYPKREVTIRGQSSKKKPKKE